MYHFKAKTLSFSSDVFQIKILWFGSKFMPLIIRWVLKIFRVLLLYDWKSKHNAVAAALNINAAFGKRSANECTIRHWNAKFETGDESLTSKDQGRPETVVDNKIMQKN